MVVQLRNHESQFQSEGGEDGDQELATSRSLFILSGEQFCR